MRTHFLVLFKLHFFSLARKLFDKNVNTAESEVGLEGSKGKGVADLKR